MKRLRKFARSMSELLIAVVVLGVIVALLIALNNAAGTKYAAATAKKTQFESTIGDIQKAMIGDSSITPQVACNATALRNYYISNLSGATAIDYFLDGKKVAALRIPGYGILAIVPNEQGFCEREWQADTLNPNEPPVALVAIQDGANPDADDIPINIADDSNGDGFGEFGGINPQYSSARGNGSSNNDGRLFGFFATSGNDDNSSDTFVLGTNLLSSTEIGGFVAGSSSGSTNTPSSTPSSTPTVVTLPEPSEECPLSDVYYYAYPTFTLTDNVSSNTYNAYNDCDPDSVFRTFKGVDSYCCKLENKKLYLGHNSRIGTDTCAVSFCEGNGFATAADAAIYMDNRCESEDYVSSVACKNVKLVNTGRVNYACGKGERDALDQCMCPEKRPFWVPKQFYKQTFYYDYNGNPYIDGGRCVVTCQSAVNDENKPMGLIINPLNPTECACDRQKGFVFDDNTRHGTYTCVCPDGYTNDGGKCVEAPSCNPATATMGSVSITRIYNASNTTADKCMCPSLNNLGSSEKEAVEDFLFRNKAQ